eukprot:CAMPEP_0115093610 /NCGR_PEP_ID=MMETSP0227-20121206/27703_1 /TAXON_ID=89957 /ORGANISM="Polarella glacialis, Strain CCMP 1383" /LENGTH=69 /DNA_ID=CAMNT_0002486131 /DNA_START=482 /DNA_END=688 /DNA_ORIENTATION=+
MSDSGLQLPSNASGAMYGGVPQMLSNCFRPSGLLLYVIIVVENAASQIQIGLAGECAQTKVQQLQVPPS